MELKDIIRKYRKEHHQTMQEFADKANLTKGYISQIENGYSFSKSGKKLVPSLETLQKLAKAMNYDINDLLSSVDIDISTTGKDEIISVKSNHSVTIPLYEAICCGNGGFVEDNIIDFISLPSDILEPSKEYFAQYAKGDSMTGAGIEDGDLLVFEKSGSIDSGKIGCFCIDDNEAMCKRFRVTSDHEIYLMPANDKYDPIHINIEDQHFRCIGILATVISDRRDD